MLALLWTILPPACNMDRNGFRDTDLQSILRIRHLAGFPCPALDNAHIGPVRGRLRVIKLLSRQIFEQTRLPGAFLADEHELRPLKAEPPR